MRAAAAVGGKEGQKSRVETERGRGAVPACSLLQMKHRDSRRNWEGNCGATAAIVAHAKAEFISILGCMPRQEAAAAAAVGGEREGEERKRDSCCRRCVARGKVNSISSALLLSI